MVVLGIIGGVFLVIIALIVYVCACEGFGYVCEICHKRYFSYRKYCKCHAKQRAIRNHNLINCGGSGPAPSSPHVTVEPPSPYPGGLNATPGFLEHPSDRR